MQAKPQPARKARPALALPQKIRIGFSIGIALYVVVWGFATWSLVLWGRDINSVVGSNQALTQIERVLSSVENAETGQRGYLLTGKPSYLADYQAGVRDTKQILTELRSTQDIFPSLRAHLDLVEELVGINFSEMAETIELRRTGDFEGARKSVLVGRGKAAMDKIRTAINETRRDSYQVLEIRSRQQRDRAHETQWRFVCGAILSLILARLAWVRLYQAVQSREFTQTALEKSALELREKTALLESQNAEILRATQLKSEFLANMSHELRTPLNSITGFSEVLIDGVAGPVNEDQREYLGEILEGSRHLLHLINDVLDLAKVESGKMTFRPEVVDLERSIQGTVQMLDLMARQKQIQIQPEIDPDGRYVFLDEARFKQVLFNFLSNALKFTPSKGSITVRVLAEAERWFRLEVQDTGIGISQKDQQLLFQEFHQLDAGVAKQFQGAGLGLALTKRIVEAQGGRVGVESEVGVGSTFFALLPRGKTELENMLTSTAGAYQTSSRER
jgi:signal transduction histidine kinase